MIEENKYSRIKDSKSTCPTESKDETQNISHLWLLVPFCNEFLQILKLCSGHPVSFMTRINFRVIEAPCALCYRESESLAPIFPVYVKKIFTPSFSLAICFSFFLLFTHRKKIAEDKSSPLEEHELLAEQSFSDCKRKRGQK